ncbi:MAG: hypothetical protein ABIP89_20405, partial [Polyangiaceae bacterium]
VDLGPFFAEWVYAERYPSFTLTKRYDASAGSVEVTLDQAQAPVEGLRFPLEIELRAGARTERATIEVAGKQTIAQVKVAFEPTSVIVDPEGWLYQESVVR